jgi:predicted MPP superfamily phosphohydrolase
MENRNHRNLSAEISRREFLKASVLVAMAPFVGIELSIGTKHVEFTRHAVRPAGASSEFITIMQLSDLHLRTIIPLQKSLAERVNAETPDAILISGDAIDERSDLKLLDNFLKLLQHNIPKVAILGNHERENNINLKKLAKIYETNNGVLLINETAPLAENGTLSRILITGLDDTLTGAPNLQKALKGAGLSSNHILMAHRPMLNYETTANLAHLRHEFNLMIAGHTHGGQINILGFTPVMPPGSGHYIKGWYHNSGIPMYVSRGIGTSAIPLRIGSKPEVAIFKYYLS